MTAREMFKENKPKGKILKCSKGGYDYGRNTFAYCICDDGQRYNIKVLSEVHPKEYSVDHNEEVNADTLENAILYNEWRARVVASKNDEECL
jgi:hypothetical protein